MGALTLPVLQASSISATVAADGPQTLAWLLIALPLLSAGFLLVAGRRTDKWGHWLATAVSVTTFVLAAWLIIDLLGRPGESRIAELDLYTWFSVAGQDINFGLRIDPLSLTFVGLITSVGSLIHVYSVAYMSGDRDRRRFFAYLNLFIAAMLVLVLADSFLLLFVGWEGVGLASYLLIGFWNQKQQYASAANKAFIANRIGDLGLIFGTGLMFAAFGSTDFDRVLGSFGQGGASIANAPSVGMATAIALLLLLAACGKSAQFPLQSWLGDAMAGPTPVSALIHAATMVTAGVYLIVRAGAIFEYAPNAQLVVVIVGAITLILGAIIGCAKDDIKKALAASTMSQIGYMVLAAGLGPVGYAFAIFHLLTHGFFKAGMFLGAGSVMHGMNDQVDMRRFGAINKAMKITWITFGAGWLAILGVPPFSGFWSKDKIIEAAFMPVDGAPWRAWLFGTVVLVGAGLTAFYMSRLFFMTFHGKARWTTAEEPGGSVHPHESPRLMTVPMILLAVGSVALGGLLSIGSGFVNWLEPVTGHVAHVDPVLPVPVLIALTLILVAGGAFLAWRQYAASTVPTTAPTGSLLTRAARQDFYQDQVNHGLLVEPGNYLTRSLVYTDKQLVDGSFNSLALGTMALGSLLRKLQNGYVRSYAALMVFGLVVALVIVLFGRN